jgi:hypothetical protein
MATKRKIGDRGGVSEWRNLSTAGDIRRFLAWAIHSMRNGSLEKGEAAVFGQLGLALLKTCQESEFEDRLIDLERKLAERDAIQQSSTITAH